MLQRRRVSLQWLDRSRTLLLGVGELINAWTEGRPGPEGLMNEISEATRTRRRRSAQSLAADISIGGTGFYGGSLGMFGATFGCGMGGNDHTIGYYH